MAGGGPLALASAVQAIALVLDGASVEVIGLNGRNAYTFESDRAPVTVLVHLDCARDVEVVADLLVLDEPHLSESGLYCCAGDWMPGFTSASTAPPTRSRT
jgi:hypothetical protein